MKCPRCQGSGEIPDKTRGALRVERGSVRESLPSFCGGWLLVDNLNVWLDGTLAECRAEKRRLEELEADKKIDRLVDALVKRSL